MRNILIFLILIGFVIFAIIITLMEKMKNQNTTGLKNNKKELLDVSDIAYSEEFAPKVVGIAKEQMTDIFPGLRNVTQESVAQPIPRVTGAIFGQGFEVSKIDRNFRNGKGSVFTSVRCS